MRVDLFSDTRLWTWTALMPALALAAWAQPAAAQDSLERAVLHSAAELLVERDMVPAEEARVAYFLQDREPLSLIVSLSDAIGQPAETTLAGHGHGVRKRTTFIELTGTALPPEIRVGSLDLRRGKPDEMGGLRGAEGVDAGIVVSPDAWILDSGAVLVEVTLFYASGARADNPRNYHTTVLMRLDETEPGRWSVTDETVVAR